MSLDAVPLVAVTNSEHTDLPDWDKFDKDIQGDEDDNAPIDEGQEESPSTPENSSFGPLEPRVAATIVPPKLPKPEDSAFTSPTSSSTVSPTSTALITPQPLVKSRSRTKLKPAKPVEPEKPPEIDYFSSLGMGPSLKASQVKVTRVKRIEKKTKPKTIKVVPRVQPAPVHTNRFNMDSLMDDDDEDIDTGDIDLDLDLGDLDLGPELSSSDDDLTLGVDGLIDLGGDLDDDSDDGPKDPEPELVQVSSLGAKGTKKTRKERKKRERRVKKKTGLGVVAL